MEPRHEGWRMCSLWTIAVMAMIPAVLIAQSREDTQLFNFSSTLSWTPGSVVECDTVECVVDAVETAKSNQQRIKAIGSGWSWSTSIARDGDTYVTFSGSMADVSSAVYDDETPSIIVPAGVKAFDLYMALQATDYNVEAKGNCLSARASQTIGGLLASNVHHSGMKSFYDVTDWVEVVTADGLVRTYPNETLFQLTVGGVGRTGVIVRANLLLAPRQTYESMEVPPPPDDLFSSFLNGFVELTNGHSPNEFIALGLRSTGLFNTFVPRYTVKRRMAQPSLNPAMLPSDYGQISSAFGFIYALDSVFDAMLPPSLYNLFYMAMIATFLNGRDVETDGKVGEDLDVASSLSSLVQLKHQEIEFFVPVGLVEHVGAFLDARFANGFYPYVNHYGLFALRHVYGTDSLTAANGRLFDSSKPDFVCVNIDSFQKSKWGTFHAELNQMLADLSAEFPMQIRTHPGKYNPLLSPDPESQAVKDMIRAVDLQGIFSREEYDPIYLTSRPEA